jgi:hypothetical protein
MERLLSVGRASGASRRPMSIENTQKQTESQQAPERAAGRSTSEIARIRRRAIVAALAILLLLLVIGLGESLGGFLPHTTPAFANGKTQAAGNLQVTLQFTPNPPKISGDPATQVMLLLQDHAGQQINGAQVHVSLAMVTMDMGASDYPTQALGQGRYQTKVAFVMIGEWQVMVSITQPGDAAVATIFTVDVAA